MTIPDDKIKHLLVGYGIGATLGGLIGLILVVVAGAGKELYDHYSGKGTPDIWDAGYTWIGGVIGLAAHFLIALAYAHLL